MGYYVDYSVPAREKQSSGSFLRIAVMTTAFFLAFCLISGSVWPQGQEILQQLFFPGSSDATRQAAEVFVAELQNGEAVSDALENFCHAVFADADIP